MWYRFSKLKWVWDMTDGIDYSYAYVKANSEEEAIKKCNESSIPKRKFDVRGMDVIDEVKIIPIGETDKVVL